MTTLDPRDFNRRTTSRPIGGEELTSGERARRAALVASMFPGMTILDPIRIHEFLAGTTDTFTVGGIPWERMASITVLEDVA